MEKYVLGIGHTPQTMVFFSADWVLILPGKKYAQVVRHISGAMGKYNSRGPWRIYAAGCKRQFDNAYEDIIAHELFHHWFGDLVRCESWSDVPLNESFATYGQISGTNTSMGRDEADYGLHTVFSEYFVSSKSTSPPLIRHDYNNREDLFDAASQ